MLLHASLCGFSQISCVSLDHCFIVCSAACFHATVEKGRFLSMTFSAVSTGDRVGLTGSSSNSGSNASWSAALWLRLTVVDILSFVWLFGFFCPSWTCLSSPLINSDLRSLSFEAPALDLSDARSHLLFGPTVCHAGLTCRAIVCTGKRDISSHSREKLTTAKTFSFVKAIGISWVRETSTETLQSFPRV